MAKVVYAALNERTGKNGTCWPAQATLAADLGCSLSTVGRAIKELVEAGYLVVKHSFGSSRYYLRPWGDGNTAQSDMTEPEDTTAQSNMTERYVTGDRAIRQGRPSDTSQVTERSVTGDRGTRPTERDPLELDPRESNPLTQGSPPPASASVSDRQKYDRSGESGEAGDGVSESVEALVDRIQGTGSALSRAEEVFVPTPQPTQSAPVKPARPDWKKSMRTGKQDGWPSTKFPTPSLGTARVVNRQPQPRFTTRRCR